MPVRAVEFSFDAWKIESEDEFPTREILYTKRMIELCRARTKVGSYEGDFVRATGSL